MPLVKLKSAEVPSAVLFPGKPPSGAGVTAKAFGAGATAQQAMSQPIRTKPNRRGDPPIDSAECRVFIFFFLFIRAELLNLGMTLTKGTCTYSGASGSSFSESALEPKKASTQPKAY